MQLQKFFDQKANEAEMVEIAPGLDYDRFIRDCKMASTAHTEAMADLPVKMPPGLTSSLCVFLEKTGFKALVGDHKHDGRETAVDEGCQCCKCETA